MNDTRPIPREVLESLGFDGDATLLKIEGVDVPEATTGHGYSLTSAFKALSLGALLSGPVAAQPSLFAQSRIAGAGDQAIEVSRWEREPGIAIVRCAAGVLSSAVGAPIQPMDGGDLAVDARGGPVAVRVESAEGSRIVVIDRTTTTAYRVDVADSSEVQALRGWSPARAEDVHVPALSSVVDAVTAPAWLRDQVSQRLSIAAPYSIAAAYGLPARLSPPVRVSHAEALSAPPPSDAGARWVATLSPVQRASLLARALEEVDALEADLEPLAHDLAHRAPSARTQARSWLHRRDDLASVASVLKAAGIDATSLEDALDQLDTTASTWQSMWSACEPFDDDDRLLEVAWQEPDHWWGALALE